MWFAELMKRKVVFIFVYSDVFTLVRGRGKAWDGALSEVLSANKLITQNPNPGA